MKFLLSTLLLAIGATADLRGAVKTVTHNKEETEPRRALIPAGTECVTYERILMFEDGSDEESWACQFSLEDAKEFGASMMELGAGNEILKAAGAISGATVLRIREPAYIQPSIVSNNIVGPSLSSPIFLPQDVDFEITMMDEDTDVRHYRHRQRSRRRRLATSKGTTGTMDTLVIRVVDGNSVSTERTMANLLDDVFTDGSCLKSRYHDCSYGQLNIKNAGIIDVEINEVANNNNYKNIEYGARNATHNNLYSGSYWKMFQQVDLVMYCMPPGSYQLDSRGQQSTNWVAYAYINHIESFYNDKWCGYVTSQVHEVGHNLGLAHSGLIDKSEYSDTSDPMGFSYSSDDGPDICFNAAKSYQLRWYEEDNGVASIDPLNLLGGSQSFDIIGVADYKTANGLVSLRLEYEGHKQGGLEWYVGYNRNFGIHDGVPNDEAGAPNEVHIIQKQNVLADPYNYGQSYRIAALEANQDHTWTIGDNAVTLRVNSINGAIASITISNDMPTPTAAPVATPTLQPVAGPTAAPVVTPTLQPVMEPTAAPVATTPTLPPTEDSECTAGKKLFLEVRLDDKSGSEFGWMIANGATGNGWYGRNNFVYTNGGLLQYEFCLPTEQCWNVIFQDLGNDGICGGNGDCYYKAWVDGEEVISGGNFASEATHKVCIGTETVCKDKTGKLRYRKRKNSKKIKKTSCKKLNQQKGRTIRKICNYYTGKEGYRRVGDDMCFKTCGERGLGSCDFLQNYPSSDTASPFPLPGAPVNGEVQAGDTAEAMDLVPVHSINDNIFLHSP